MGDQHWTPPYRLYVVEFETGLLKAGISSQPNGRRIKGFLRTNGPIRHQFTSEVVAGFAVEWEMLQRLGARATCVKGREWFTGIAFADAVEIAQSVIRSFESADPPSRPQSHGRNARGNLSLNDAELDVLKRYAAHVGKPVSQAARELAMSEIVRLLHGNDSLATV